MRRANFGLRMGLAVAASLLLWSTAAGYLRAQTPALHPASEFADPGIERLPSPAPAPGEEPVEIEIIDPGLPLDQPIEPVVVAEPEEPIRIWSGSFELGVNGAEGNSEALNIRIGSHVKRQAKYSALTIDALYRKDSRGSEVTANRFYFDARQEWPHEATPWTLFIHNLTELDDFQAWDTRVTVDAGVGYQFIENDLTSLISRVSAGAEREFGGPDDEVAPQGLVGFDLQHKITQRQSLGATVDYFFDWSQIEEFRLNSRVEYTILLDQESNLSVKFSVLNRHDSNPHGKKPNDLDYAVLLLWEF